MGAPAPAYGVKAITLQFLVATLKKQQVFDDVCSRATPSARALLVDPLSSRLHDGQVVGVLYEELLALLGEERLLAVSVAQAKGPSMRVLEGFLRVLLLATEASPATLFNRLQSFVDLMLTGVRTSYVATSQTSGEVVFDYPNPQGRAAFVTWKGALLFAFEVTKTKGDVRDLVQVYPSSKLRFGVSWGGAVGS